MEHFLLWDNVTRLYNGPITFQRLMNKVLELYLRYFARIFIDNIWIYWDRASQSEKLEKVFERLVESEFTLNAEKIEIGYSSGHLVGHIVFRDGIGIDLKKIYFMIGLPFPITKRGVRAFFRISGYYCRFIERYVIITKFLTSFLKDNAPPPQATPAALEAFEKL